MESYINVAVVTNCETRNT